MVLLVNPVLLGIGKRLFAEATPPRAFATGKHARSALGIVVNTFRLAVPLRNRSKEHPIAFHDRDAEGICIGGS
jgi:hypothetical protein